MNFMRGEVEHCAECGSYFCRTCEEDGFMCENCGEFYCPDCAEVVVMNDWCRYCLERYGTEEEMK